jgi:hypothetical protein
MAANRTPKYAPAELLSMTKATLADLVWELAALDTLTATDFPSRAASIRERAEELDAPRGDLKAAERLRDRLRGSAARKVG